MLKIQFLRDGHNLILGNETRFENGDVVARDRDDKILGRASNTFGNTRDGNAKLVSRLDDPGLLFRK
jgi:hypothetical protein